MDELTLKQYEKLGPFEIKDFLQKVASKAAVDSSISYLNAGRGNPNWVATEPREAFFLLGQFAITECKRVLDLPPGVGGMPKAPGIAARLAGWLDKHGDMPGAPFLQRMVPWTVKKFGFDPDKFVHELVDSIIGDHYPVPDRMLVHNEEIVHEYLEWAMCGDPRPKGKFKIYAVEGGTAAMCYIFKSLKSNRIINPGDTIALGVPIFTPYIEMAHLEDYDLHFVEVAAKQENRFQYPDEELKKLLDPKIKAFFVVNPGNPYAVAISQETIDKIGAILKKRPDLILLTDDVYGTFVPGFRSLMGAFPQEHDRRLFVQQVLRLHRVAPGHGRGPRGQHLRRDDRQAPRADQEEAGQALRRPHARAAQACVHRSHRGRQPRRRAESHGGPVAAATGDDVASRSKRSMSSSRTARW